MGDINLYQYPISPFTEKLRRVLVHKGLKWNPIDCHYEDKTNLLADRRKMDAGAGAGDGPRRGLEFGGHYQMDR